MKKWFFKIGALWLFLYGFSSFGANYYCHSHKDRLLSDVDQIIKLSKISSGRIIKIDESFYAHEIFLFKTYDEGGKVITTYYDLPTNKKSLSHFFYVFEFNLKSKLLTLYKANYSLISSFQKGYGLPWTEQNERKLNTNPHLFRYLPEKKPNQAVVSYSKSFYYCKSISFLESKIQSVKLFLLRLMAI